MWSSKRLVGQCEFLLMCVAMDCKPFECHHLSQKMNMLAHVTVQCHHSLNRAINTYNLSKLPSSKINHEAAPSIVACPKQTSPKDALECTTFYGQTLRFFHSTTSINRQNSPASMRNLIVKTKL